MSGSGGGGYAPRESRCGNLSFSTVLGSPKRTVLALIRKGQILDLVLNTTPTKVVVAMTNAGQIAGTITTMTQKLIECIEEGNSYEAEVTKVTGLQCSVDVRPK